ncbi:MAG: hypothetical protein ACYDCL_10000 [Myxococcales bacterium]
MSPTKTLWILALTAACSGLGSGPGTTGGLCGTAITACTTSADCCDGFVCSAGRCTFVSDGNGGGNPNGTSGGSSLGGSSSAGTSSAASSSGGCLFGCPGGSSTGGASSAGASSFGSSGGSSSGGSSTGASSGGGPIILSFGTNVTSLTENQSVTFVAVVTDPAGLQYLVGGNLQSAGGTIQYGAFQATTQGSYSLTLSWDQINQANPINFPAGQNVVLTFEAVFFEQSGLSTTRLTQLTFDCGNGGAACAGICCSSGDVCDPGLGCVVQSNVQPDGGCGTDTWSNYADGFFQVNCDVCHSNYDSYAGVAADSARIESDLTSGAMPLGGGLSQQDQQRIIAWINCGMPQ